MRLPMPPGPCANGPDGPARTPRMSPSRLSAFAPRLPEFLQLSNASLNRKTPSRLRKCPAICGNHRITHIPFPILQFLNATTAGMPVICHCFATTPGLPTICKALNRCLFHVWSDPAPCGLNPGIGKDRAPSDCPWKPPEMASCRFAGVRRIVRASRGKSSPPILDRTKGPAAADRNQRLACLPFAL